MRFWSWLFRKKKPAKTRVSSPEDRAVLIGINSYPSAPLHGCVFDIENIGKFAPAQRITLLNDKATTDAIIKALEWLAQTPPNAKAFLWYSGHGVEVTVADGIAQAICPVDFDWSSERMITDRQLVDIFSKMDSTVRFFWGSDSCHSGNLDTKAFGTRTIQPPTHIAVAVLNAKARGFRVIRMPAQLNVGFISGCRHDQTSTDTEINGQPCGAFTWYFVQAYQKMPLHSTLVRIASSCRDALVVQGYDQIPQVDGPRINDPFLE